LLEDELNKKLAAEKNVENKNLKYVGYSSPGGATSRCRALPQARATSPPPISRSRPSARPRYRHRPGARIVNWLICDAL